MSLQTRPIPPTPELTTTVARRAFRKGNIYMQMRDVFGAFFTNDQFTDLYPADGQPGYAPWRLALVSVMQFAENLTDRQAADAVRSRIDWKYALSLQLTDEGFDFSVLSEFRGRLLAHEAGERLLNTMLEQFVQAGLLSSGGKQRTDSTHVLASVRDLNRLELAGRTLQTALDAIADVIENFARHWDQTMGDRKGQEELIKLIVARVWVKDGRVVALSLRPDYHVSLGLESEKPTEISVGSDFVQPRERRGSGTNVYTTSGASVFVSTRSASRFSRHKPSAFRVQFHWVQPPATSFTCPHMLILAYRQAGCISNAKDWKGRSLLEAV